MEPQKIGVCVVVLDKSKKKILLGKRLSGYRAGLYGIPGGRLDLTEKLIDCGKRELVEETGLIANSLEYLGVIRDMQGSYNFIEFAYICTNYEGEPIVTEPDRCAGWEWFSFDQIPENTLPGHKTAINFFLNPSSPSVGDISSI